MLVDLPLRVKATKHGNRQFTRVNKHGFPCTKAREIRNHCKTGDIVLVTVTKDRKQIKTGKHLGRVKGTTERSADVQIGSYRIIPAFDDIKFIHKQDGYRYV